MRDELELHGTRTGNCFRASIALEESGLAYRVHRVDLRHGEQYEDAYLALNPSGKVPTLVDRSGSHPFVLSQSNAIILYAAERVPGRLVPIEPGATRGRTYERFFLFVTDVIVPNFDAAMLRYQGATEGSRLLEERALQGLHWAERYASEARFMSGEHFSIADIVAYTFVLSLDSRIEWQHLPNVSRWFQEVKSRPGVQRGLHAFDEVNPQ